MEWAKKLYPKEQIRLVFEKGVPTGELSAWFERQKDRTPALAQLEFREKKDVIPLQAADVHAYEGWKHTQNQLLAA